LIKTDDVDIPLEPNPVSFEKHRSLQEVLTELQGENEDE